MKRNLNILSFFLSILFFIASLSFSEEKVQYLKKVGEIKEGFSSERENFFIKITGLCCDDEGNLYVADSGWNKIFKFDSNGKFLMSFGREGQGPGEFMGQRMSNHLKISFGNDGKLYVNDPGNSRISVFTKEGKFLKSHKTPPFTYDTPVVNSRGDIYLLSKSGIKAIDCYDSNFKYKGSLLDMEEHLQFPFGKPFPSYNYLRIPNEFELMKSITKDDNLVALSNYSLKIFIFGQNGEKINEFDITEKEFIEDFKVRLEKLREENKKNKDRIKGYEPSNLLLPFKLLTANDKLKVIYMRSDRTFVIYEWSDTGKLFKKYYIKGEPFISQSCFNEIGFIYTLIDKGMRIGIYKVVKNYLKIKEKEV